MKQFKFNERQRFSIRKFSIGAASVLLGSVFFAVNSVTEVQAMEASSNTVIANDTDRDLGSVPTAKSEEVSPSSMTPEEDKNNSESGILVSPILDSNPKKQALAKLIEEIDGKISSGAYDEKTEDSVNRLKAVLEEAKATVNTATTEGELTQAHSRLVTATTQLKTKPEEKKEAPAVDTTNGKSTVGIKATNTEKASDSNSIANSGSRDERNGKALDKNRAFRTEAATTNTDPAANQTYTAPDENADLTTLADKLKNLPNVIENNKKVQDMDTLGNALNVDKGSVKEINEFGGWEAVGENGKFAIARATDKGVFPIETVNVLSNNQAWIEEQSFDKSSKYMLFLSKVRTKANRTDESYDGSQYKESGEGGPRGAWIAKGTKGFDGIEKTFRAYNPKEGTTVKIKFKTGYTGIIEDARGSDKSRAKYKVTVFDTTDGKNNEIYSVSFDPGTNIKNNEMTVVAAKNGSGGNVPVNGTSEQAKNAALETMSQSRYKSGSGGTFESKDIVLAPGVKTYKVIISSADNLELGMSYQSSFLQYALPVTGLDYSIDQDTSAIAKNLLQRVYDKLKATEAQDIKGKTDETISAYKGQLKNVENLLAVDLKNTQEYKDILTAVLDGQKALRTDKSKLTASNTKLLDLINETPDPRIGKTPNSITPYDSAKEEAKKAQAEAQNILNQENPNPDEVATAVSKLNEKLAELKAAKAALVDKVTEAQKTTLGNAGTDLAVLGEAELAGKTKETADAYKAETGKLTEEIAAAKREAEAILADPENKTQAEAALVEAKIAALKAKLEAAKAKLVAKADTAELSAAKADLDTKAKEVVPTEGKTKATVDAYNEAKTAAAKAVADAEAVINDENVTDKAVANALAEVKAKKAALEAAKAALVDKITQDQKDDLANVEENLKLADTTGKTKDSIKAYNDEVAKLSDELAAAKQAAKDLVDKGDNAGELEAYRVQAKINKLKSKLAEAAKLLKDIDKSAAKKEVEDAAKNANDAIDDNADLTPEQKDVAKAKVAEEATKAIGEIDKATTEDDVTAAKNAGKFAIEKEAAKAEVEATKAAKEKVIDANDKLSDDEKQAAKDAVEEAATNAIQAIDAAQDQSTVDSAKTTGKEAVDAVNPVGKEKALEAVEKIANEKTKAIDANDKLSDKEKKVAKDSVAEEASKAAKAINDAQNQEAVDNAKNAGTAAVEAVNPVGKEKALAAIDKALAEKEKAIDANDKLSGAEKEAAKEEAKKAADEAKRAINEAKDQVAVDAKQTEGTNAVEAVNPVGKEKALDAIQKATEDKLAEIDRDDKLSDKEKAKAKAEVAKAAIDAVNAINEATDQAAVNAKQTEGIKAVSEVNPVGKDKAKAEIEKELAEKTNAIDSNPDLTDAQKADAKAKLVEEAKKAIAEIDKATTTEEVTSAKESGKLAIEKEAAKAEIEAAKAAKEKAIDANPDLTEDEKAEAKARVEEEAEAAKNAIDKATELSDIDKVTETGKDDIKKVTVTSAKEEAKKAIDEALAAKEKAIDARTDLTQEEKEAAKNAAREEAEAAKNAIDKATTSEDINKVLEDGKDNIAKINPENLKDKAKKAIDEALAAKEKEIDARTDLLPEEKEAAKNAAREEAEAAKNAIDKATTSEDINKVLEDGKENIANINPVGAKEEAKKAVEEALANKEKELDGRTDLTSEEKVKAKELAREEAKAAKDAIDKAISIDGIEKALRPFLYQIDQDALVFDRPELDIKAALQASITGTVIAERGNAITQADIIAKLNLPETVTVMNIELPDTTTLGRKFAKVTLKLADGTQATVSVPVEVVEKSEENHQQNNTQVKPQEVSKPAAEPSKNSEQVEDGKDTPSKASEEKNSSKQTVLPNTGTADSTVAMVAAAASALLGLGLAGRRRKEDEEA